jgi:hypothetical protein
VASVIERDREGGVMSKEKDCYRVTIQDRAGRQRQFHCKHALSHEQGSSFASMLIDRFSKANPGNAFHTTEVKPKMTKINSTHVRYNDIPTLIW